MTVYNAGNIYLEDLNGGTSDQIHIYAQTDNIADGAVTSAKLADDVKYCLDYGYTDSIGLTLEKGKINLGDGTDGASNYHIRSVGYFQSDSDIYVRKTINGSIYVVKYSAADDSFLGYVNFNQSVDGGVIPAAEGVKYRIDYTRIPQEPVSTVDAWSGDFALLNEKSEKIEEIDGRLQDIEGSLDDDSINYGYTESVPVEWKVGFINSVTGAETTGTGAIIPVQAVSLSGDIVVRKTAASILQIYCYSADNTFVRTGVDEGVTDYRYAVDTDKTYKFCFYHVPAESYVTVADLKKDLCIAYASDKLPFLARYSDVSGKKWVTIGDSLTDPVTLSVYTGEETKNYANIVAERLGLTLTNLGKSGTGYWRKSTISPFMAFFQRVADIPLDTDIVTLFGSFNDMGRDGEVLGRDILGTVYDTTTDTVGGCINQAFLNIFERVPNAVVGVILPTPWNAMTVEASEIAIYEPYVNLVKSIAERYSLPVLDLFHHSDLRPWSDDFKTTYYLSVSDGTHPNHYGHMRISGMIADFVESLARCN